MEGYIKQEGECNDRLTVTVRCIVRPTLNKKLFSVDSPSGLKRTGTFFKSFFFFSIIYSVYSSQ